MCNNKNLIFVIQIAVTVLCLVSTECRRVKRVVGGVEVNCGTQPRVASLRNSTTLQHLCGATALSPHFALTAAHCVPRPPAQYLLLLKNYCAEAAPRAEVLKIFVNELYDKHSKAHDIALLRMSLDLDDTSWLDESALPRSSFGVSDFKKIFTNDYTTNIFRPLKISEEVSALDAYHSKEFFVYRNIDCECTLFGYGRIGPDTRECSETLRAARVTIVSLDSCTSALGPIAPQCDSGMMCAVGDGTDACQGDSGSPIVCNSLLEGVSSHGLSCGVAGVPGVYASVGACLPWIHRTMQAHTKQPYL